MLYIYADCGTIVVVDTQSRQQDVSRSQGTPSFWHAVIYPYRRKKGFCTILWLLVPIVGWLLFIGYYTRITQSFCEGKYKKLPAVKAVDCIGTGFFILLKLLPFHIILMAIGFFAAPETGLFGPSLFLLYNIISIFFGLFIMPFLTVHFLYREDATAYFQWGILRHARTYAREYFLVAIKTILLSVVYVIIHVLLVAPVLGAVLAYNSAESAITPNGLIIPLLYFSVVMMSLFGAIIFTQNIFFGNFYRRRVLRK